MANRPAPHAHLAALIQMVGQGCTIWSAPGPWQSAGLRPHTASASCLLADGRQLSWKCQTPDGKASTHLEICDRDYLLANGGLFLISTRAGKTQVVQTKQPEYEFTSLHDLEPLSDQLPEVAQFLAGKPIAQKAPVGEQRRSVTPPSKDPQHCARMQLAGSPVFRGRLRMTLDRCHALPPLRALPRLTIRVIGVISG